jgi:RNA polymerase subunit RPABC4/transcription elongation factor Spt4
MTEILQPILDNKAFQFASLVVGIVGFLLAVALVFWLWRDARRRGGHEWIWMAVGAAFVLVGAIVGFGQTKFGFASVGLISLLLILVCLIVYTLVRPSEFLVDVQEREMSLRLLDAELDVQACPACGAGIEPDFQICPVCNVTLRRPCEYCGRPINPKWKTCPYCKAHQNGGGSVGGPAPTPARSRAQSKSSSKASKGSASKPKARTSSSKVSARKSSDAAPSGPLDTFKE